MSGQRVTRELMANLRPGDVIELRTPEGSENELFAGGRVGQWTSMGGRVAPGALTLGDGRGPSLGLTQEGGEPATWVRDLELTVVHRAPQLYENSTRPEPTSGDIVCDRDQDAWRFDGEVWCKAQQYATSIRTTAELTEENGPLVLLWDGTTGSLPGATS